MDVLGRGCRVSRGVLALVLVTMLGLAACGDDSGSSEERPRIVTTTPVLGSLVEMVVGDAAEVQVLMPNGADPHDFQASARDASDLRTADLVVENGLGLEAGIQDAIARARGDGTPTFTVTDHVALRRITPGHTHDDDEHAEEEDEHTEEDEHEHGGGMDPHVWLDPVRMADMVPEMATEIAQSTGLDTISVANTVAGDLRDLDTRLEGLANEIARPDRRLVTGHDSLGYFSARYGFTVIGTVIPSVSSEGAASAAGVAELRDTMAHDDVSVIAVETGAPQDVTASLARQTGATVIELAVNTIPPDGTYDEMMEQMMARLVSALGA